MRDKISEVTSDTKTIYATMLSLAAAVFGQQYYADQQDPRPDPFTGTQGAALERDVDALEAVIQHFIERGPKDIRLGVKQNEILLNEIRAALNEFTIREIRVRAQHDELEKLIREIRDDHYSKRHNQG